MTANLTFFERDLGNEPPPELLTGDDVVTRGTAAAWATFSKCERYRYVLGRVWDEYGPLMVCCLLNPSTATDEVLDPTLRRVQGFAKRDHYGGFLIVNCFAYRSTDRKALLKVFDPVGPRNDEAIASAARSPLLARFVAGWGRPDSKKIERRMSQVKILPIGRHIWTFGDRTKGGFPRHPLYLRADTPIQEWIPKWT